MKIRTALNRSLACFAALATSLVPGRAALDPTSDKILYEVGTAHLDTQWNWTIRDTINSYVPNTLRQNFTLFTKYPDYVFSFEGSFRYRLAKEYYPADYATMKDYIAQGRWRVSGSAVDAGDVNIPSPESLIRQILYGNGFWKQEFGKTSTDIFLPDCFGFGYALPSVAAHCGLNGFSSQKLSWGSAIPIPFRIGKWIGPDGSYLVAALDPGSYTSTISTNLAYNTSALNRINSMGAATGLYIDYRYVGTGDTGGSPTDSSINWLQQSVDTTGGLINVLSAASDQLFRDLTPAHINLLSSYQGELLMSTHGTGCYTSEPELKKYNRQNEQRADAAERVSVIADWLQGGGSYPQDKLNRAWERFLWHQFHDDLTGTSIPAAYAFSCNDELLSLNEFGSIQRHGAGMVANGLNTAVTGVPLVVYNALAIARADIVEATVTFTNGAPAAVRVFDPAGAEVPSQMGTPIGNQVPVTFLATLPPTGIAVFDVRPSASPSTLNTGLSVSASQLESSRYRVQLNAAGDVASIFDKSANRELLKGPIRWAFLYNSSTTWPAWEVMYNNTTAAPASYLGGTPVIQIVENGPARVGLEISRNNAGSVFTERLRLAAGPAGDRIEWDVSINWGTPQTLLKVVFPLAVTNTLATYDLGLGTIQRPNATSSLYEVPAQQWADLTASNDAYGVSIMNDCKYGWDKPDNSTLRLTVLHSPAVGGSYVYQATNGFGAHRLTFAVMGHTNDWRAGQSPWTAARLNQPLQAFQTLPHAGSIGRTLSFAACNNSNVMIKTIKKAESSNEIIVRLQELTGQPQNAQLSFVSSITAARQVTGAEEPLANLTPAAGKLNVSLTPYQPMTIALTLAAPGNLIAKPASTPVSLPFNLDACSTDNNRSDGNFDNGFTYPSELMPASIVQDGITFQSGATTDGALNALSCQGQTITLNAGLNDRLYLLAAAASNDVAATFTIDGNPYPLTVRYFTGFIGQWNPAYVKNDDVAWVATHRHTPTGNDAYRFCYLFKYRIDLPPGATSLTLPNSPNLRIFAMSLARNTSADTVPAGGALGGNEFPWANAGANRRVNAAANGFATIQLDGRASADPDGTIVSYTWSKNGVTLGTGPQAVVDLPIGTNLVLLTVTDNQGASGQDLVIITVVTPLLVTISASPTNSASAPVTVQFNGQASGAGSSPADTTDDQTGTITARGQNSPNETAARAFDNASNTKWLDFSPTTSTRASWIQYQYAGAARNLVTSYTLTSANDAQERDPAAWQLLGSNDGSSWTLLDLRTNQVFATRNQTLTFTTTNTATFNIYRLQIDRVYNPSTANSVQLAELELIGTPNYVYWWSFGDGTTSTEQNPQHAFTENGSYHVVLGVASGLQTGTNFVLVTIGPPLAVATSVLPPIGPAPLTVQFKALASGGNGSRSPSDTTDGFLGTVSAQGENPPNETALKAFDNTTSTKWLDFSGDASTRASWIQHQYPQGLSCVVSSYTVSSANDALTYPGRNPADWRLLASNDGGSTWDTLDTQVNQAFTANYQTLSYSTANTNAYRLYRFQIDRIADPAAATSVQLSELEFIGKPAYSYLWAFGDGSTSTAQSPVHVFPTNGTYPVSLTVSDGAAVISRNLTVTVAPVPLSIASLTFSNLTLGWPAWGTNGHLYSTTNLAAPINWSQVTNSVQSVNDTLQTTVPMGPGNQFFQLRTP